MNQNPYTKNNRVKIKSHTGGCTHEQPCEYVGLNGVIVELEIIGDQKFRYWVKLTNGHRAHFLESDLEIESV